MSNSEGDCQQDGLHTTIKFGVMTLLSLPVFLFLETGALPIWLGPVNHLLVILGAYTIGDAVARWLRPLRRA